MGDSSKAPASVIAAAVVAILCALFFLLTCSVTFFVLLIGNLPGSTPELPPILRDMELAIMGLIMCLSIFGIVTGVALIYLRNWARISILIWGGAFTFFAAVGIPFVFLLPNITPPDAPQLPASSQHLIQWILVFTYGLPLVIGLWWLILFNRRSIKEQFIAARGSLDAALPQKPRCPLPIAVLAWFYIASVLNLVFLPFIPLRIPVFLFGLPLQGKAGLAILLLTALGFFVGGVGTLKLKPWGYYLSILLQSFWLVSGALSVFSPRYAAAIFSYMNDMQTWMHLPETPFPPEHFAQNFIGMMIFGLVIAAAILGLFLYYRRRFLEAASAASR
jgi:hypothetical protein